MQLAQEMRFLGDWYQVGSAIFAIVIMHTVFNRFLALSSFKHTPPLNIGSLGSDTLFCLKGLYFNGLPTDETSLRLEIRNDICAFIYILVSWFVGTPTLRKLGQAYEKYFSTFEILKPAGQ